MPNNSFFEQSAPVSIEWKQGELFLLDQTLLPHEVVMERQDTVEQVWQSIKMLKVRGAPAIGVSAAYGLCVAIKDHKDLPSGAFIELVKEKAGFLESARPTAVNLSWALKRMIDVISGGADLTADAFYDLLLKEAQKIHEEDKGLSRGIAEFGVPLIKDGMGIMTHCNAGALATSILGTATAPMYKAHRNGVNFKVFANETRPLLQGARLTSWELAQAGIDVTLITDNMAAHMMATGNIDMVLLGTDRVVANGDVANKIGTLGVAILARHYDIPFYVACPSSTIDMDTKHGNDIPIEERGSEEVAQVFGKQIADVRTKTRNPAFDVTPAELVTGIITERGMVNAPYDQGLRALFKGNNNE